MPQVRKSIFNLLMKASRVCHDVSSPRGPVEVILSQIILLFIIGEVKMMLSPVFYNPPQNPAAKLIFLINTKFPEACFLLLLLLKREINHSEAPISTVSFSKSLSPNVVLSNLIFMSSRMVATRWLCSASSLPSQTPHPTDAFIYILQSQF